MNLAFPDIKNAVRNGCIFCFQVYISVMKKALLIVDVQNGFITDETKHIVPLIEEQQEKYELVIATRFINLPGSPCRTLVKWCGCTPDTDDIELAFNPKIGTIVIDKYIYSCVNDSFIRLLRENGIDAVDICGIDTDVCVTKCAVDLFERNITPYVIKDLCATTAKKETIQETAIEILSRYIGKSQII